jgi:hypothetical protein
MDMVKKAAARRSGGAPRKTPDGLNCVLFVRTNQELLDKLEELRRRRSESSRGVVLSTADVARSILWDAIEDELEEEK